MVSCRFRTGFQGGLAACLCLYQCLSVWQAISLAGPVTVPESVLQAESRRIAVMQQAAPAVVAIFAAEGNGGGSGVLIDASGFAVTNFHVVQGQGGFMKCGLNDGRLYDAVLVGLDPTGDVALIRLLGRTDFPHAKIGNSDQVRAGDMVFAMGNPFLLATDLQPTVTYGMVSGVQRYQYPAGTFLEYTDCLQVDASINPGNSGGPLFNASGELIGINGRISVEKRGRVNVGAGYAISINQVMNFLDHLKSGRIVDHATLGATVTSLPDGGVVVAHILENSPAYRRGLRRGDELVSFAGRPIRSVNQFKNILGIYPKGWTVPLSYRREGERHDIQVRLMGLHRRAELIPDEDAPPEEDPRRKGPEGPEEKDHPAPDDHSPEMKPDLKKVEVPSQYAHMFVERREYANAYFNDQALKRVLSGLSDWKASAQATDRWMLTGTLNDTQPVDLRLLPDAVAAKIGGSFSVQKLNEDFQDIPSGTGGLLGALDQLKHFLYDRENYFSELYYLGSEPLPGSQQRVDVIITTKQLMTCRWYFRRDKPELIGFDASLEEDADPCEIRFEATIPAGKTVFPKILKIRHGDADWGRLTLDALQFLTESKTEAQK